jgi:hypothetical protein
MNSYMKVLPLSQSSRVLRVWVILALLAIAGSASIAQADSSDNAGETGSGEAASEAERSKANPAAEEPIDPMLSGTEIDERDQLESTLGTLQSLTLLRKDLKADIEMLNRQLVEAQTAAEKEDLLSSLGKLEDDLNATTQNLQRLAADADITALREVKEPAFNFQKELFSLLEPAMKEMKEMSSHVREKSEQRDRIAFNADKIPTAQRAVSNIQRLLEHAEDDALKEILQDMLETWQKQLKFLQSEVQAATLRLKNLENSEVSLAQASQSYLKSFYQERGRYLGQAILVVLFILLISRLSLRAMQKFIPGYQRAKRPFRIRLLDLSHRIVTGLLLIVGPMVVFYLAEDWLLFSVGILLLLGIALTVRHALPRYWQHVHLFLNVGAVREGERLEMAGLPWIVQKINFYTMLNNPTAELSKRVKIDDLVDLRSRPVKKDEPWFPCRAGDWVLLDDGSRGKVVGLSEELTQLVQRGGAHRTFTTSGFLDCTPINLSQNFRIKESIGITYALQAASVSTVPEQLHAHIDKRLEEEGYSEQLLNLRVEFEKANTSSLDLVVIADFSGELAELSNRLRRSIQRWCVEACTVNGWEIPFTQVTVHEPDSRLANRVR